MADDFGGEDTGGEVADSVSPAAMLAVPSVASMADQTFLAAQQLGVGGRA